jgi:NADH-quinone oxidoreductase subunit G/NADP-reducing hydrogenase subunit HndD
MSMKFEARRDGMMRKGISDVDSVLTVRELARLIRLYGIDVTTTAGEPADEPMEMRSSSAALAEASGGITEAVIRTLLHGNNNKEADKQVFKKIRSAGSFRDSSIICGDVEYNVAVVDGLTGLEKMNASVAAGAKYDMVEVMVCPGGCVHGAGLTLCNSKETVRNRTKALFQAEENDAVPLPVKSPALLNLYEKSASGIKEIENGSIYKTHYSRRDVLL